MTENFTSNTLLSVGRVKMIDSTSAPPPHSCGSSGNGSTKRNEACCEKKWLKNVGSSPVERQRQKQEQFVGNLFAWHCLSQPVMDWLPFSHVFHGAGNRRRFVQLGFNLPVVSRGLKRPPRAGLLRLRMQGMQVWLQLDLEKKPDLKADPKHSRLNFLYPLPTRWRAAAALRKVF